MLNLGKARDPFLRMRKKMVLNPLISKRENKVPSNCEAEAPSPIQKKTSSQKGNRKGVKLPDPVVTTPKDPKRKAKVVFPYKTGRKSVAPPPQDASKRKLVL